MTSWDDYEFDIVDEIDFDGSLTLGEKIDRLRAALPDLEPDTELRRHLLNVLADHLQTEQRYDEVRGVLKELSADSPRGAVETDMHLVPLELELERPEEADAALARLLDASRSGLLGPFDHALVAESLELNGRKRESIRWYTIPIRDVHPDDLEEQDFHCVIARWRVRRELSLPMDAYDEAAEEIQDMLAADDEF